MAEPGLLEKAGQAEKLAGQYTEIAHRLRRLDESVAGAGQSLQRANEGFTPYLLKDKFRRNLDGSLMGVVLNLEKLADELLEQARHFRSLAGH